MVLIHRLNVYKRPKYWGIYKKNILIYSQMIFHLDERHSLKATVLENGKTSINWVSLGNFETLVALIGKPTHLKFFTDKDYI